jgi:hypothetical protein
MKVIASKRKVRIVLWSGMIFRVIGDYAVSILPDFSPHGINLQRDPAA